MAPFFPGTKLRSAAEPPLDLETTYNSYRYIMTAQKVAAK